MRELTIGTQKHTKVVVTDEPDAEIGGGACHHYEVLRARDGVPLHVVDFQKGPIKEHGVNGIHNEDLLAIVIDRLQGFQRGEYSCRENALAIRKLMEALQSLRDRTDAREARGVEGTHEV